MFASKLLSVVVFALVNGVLVLANLARVSGLGHLGRALTSVFSYAPSVAVSVVLTCSTASASASASSLASVPSSARTIPQLLMRIGLVDSMETATVMPPSFGISLVTR